MLGKQKPFLGSRIDTGHPLAQGLVGCWLFNEGSGGRVTNLVDNAAGILQNMESTDWSWGPLGRQLTFGGTDEYIATAVASEPQDFTILVMMKHDGTAVWRGFFGDASFQFGLNNQDRIAFHPGDGNTQYSEFGQYPAADEYIQIGGVRRGTEFDFYQKGVWDATRTTNVGQNTWDADNIFVGRGQNNEWIGDLVYVYVYDHAKTANEIAYLHAYPYAFIRDEAPELWAPATQPAAATTSTIWLGQQGGEAWGRQKPFLGSRVNTGHPLAQGLVGCWLMNEGSGPPLNLVDAQLGSFTNMDGSNWGAGEWGHKLALNGSDEYVSTPANGTVLAGDPFSLRVIFERTQTAWQCLFGKKNANEWYLYLDGNNWLYFFGGASYDSNVAVPIDTVVDAWVVFDGNDLHFYTDGSLVTTHAGASTSNEFGLNDAAMGWVKSGEYFQGDIITAQLWNGRALTPGEIAELHALPYCMIDGPVGLVMADAAAASTTSTIWLGQQGGEAWGKQKPFLGSRVNTGHPLAQGLVGCWLFNGGGGDSEADLSGNGLTATGDLALRRVVTERGYGFNFALGDWATVSTDLNAKIEDAVSIFCVAEFDGYSLYNTIFNNNSSTGYRFLVHATGVLRFGVDDGSNLNTDLSITSLANGFHSFAATYDGASTYVDIDGGALSASGSKTGTVTGDASPALGGYTSGREWRTGYTLCYIYNRALAPGEIAHLNAFPYCMIDGPVGLVMADAAAGAPPVSSASFVEYYYHLLLAGAA